ncbi:MAG TPA: dUTP diphosphatase [Candidatus Nanoarchaeia archaeon]|nr:dUTP diphosphatase [Candidatus Nanoarchaeia archaeon]
MVKNILKLKKLFAGIETPEYAFPTDVGFDLRAAEAATLAPYEQKAVRTGIAVEIPEGHVGLIRDRAGIITKMNVHTAAGTFDPAYRGEVSVVLINFGEESVSVEPGMRIAQMIIIPVTRVQIKEVKDLGETERHDKGFGSTGMKEIIKIEKSIKGSKKKNK